MAKYAPRGEGPLMIVEPSWYPINITMFGELRYEIEHDDNAEPGSSDAFRHREKRYTGQEEAEWTPGLPQLSYVKDPCNH